MWLHRCKFLPLSVTAYEILGIFFSSSNLDLLCVQVRTTVEQLKVAHKWVQDIAACAVIVDRHSMASSGKAVKVPLARIQELVAVDPVPWVEPHLFKLKVSMSS